MASPARISGLVLSTDRRQGTAKASGKDYDFTEVNVLVSGRGVTVITGSTDDMPRFTNGDVVDLEVDFDVYAGRLSSRFVQIWDTANDHGLPANFAA